MTVTYLEIDVAGYTLRTVGADAGECIATMDAFVRAGEWAELMNDTLTRWTGDAKPAGGTLTERWLDYTGAAPITLTAGQVHQP